MKKLKLFVLILALGISVGCRKNIVDTENATSLKSVSTTQATIKITSYMVITKSEILPANFEKKLSVYGQILKSIPEIGILVVKPNVADFEQKVAKLTEVLSVVPDLKTKWIEPQKFVAESNPASIGSNETFFIRQWGMDAINAPEAWNAGYTGAGAKVFILDSGIDADNPDLVPNLDTVLSTSFVPGEVYNVSPGASFSHGTHVAGIIAAADNSWGVIGVAPNARIVAVKVISEFTGSGAFSWINAGIVYAANNGANVINMSLGARFDRNGFYYDENDVLQKIPAVYLQNIIVTQQRAITYAFKKGVTIICSAGNDAENADGNKSIIHVPGDLQNVIAVSATAPDFWYGSWISGAPDPAFTAFDVPASYTNYGKSLIKVAAPGGDFDFYPQNNYQYDMVLSSGAGGPTSYPFYYAAGTSMAAPHVTGVAALIIAKYNGKLSPLEVTKKLMGTADKIDGQGISLYFGSGRINAYRAVTE